MAVRDEVVFEEKLILRKAFLKHGRRILFINELGKIQLRKLYHRGLSCQFSTFCF